MVVQNTPTIDIDVEEEATVATPQIRRREDRRGECPFICASP